MKIKTNVLKRIFRKNPKNSKNPKNQQAAAPEKNERLEEIAASLRKIEARQKETNLELEEITEALQSDESGLTGAIISIADLTEEFYRFASDNPDSALFEQAQMMWRAATKAISSADIDIIDDCRKPFDFRLHTTEGVGTDETIPNGYVVKTLKCGYARRGKIIRRAAVVVNKSKENFL
jgi:molecular chaperone GrpE (heat shock protein)